MTTSMLLWPLLIPFLTGCLTLLVPESLKKGRNALLVLGTVGNAVAVFPLFGKDLDAVIPWAGFGIDFALRLYHFSSFILLAIAAFGLLLAFYSSSSMGESKSFGWFSSFFLITVAFANGAVLADNFVLFLFFWEGLLGTLFGMIFVGGAQAWKTAMKAVVISGLADLCLTLGIGITVWQAGTLTISKICLPVEGVAGVGFVFLMIGAIAKAGSMPFHSWIPDAAVDAPLPFMALVPAAIEKLLGIYFLSRIALDLFKIDPHSWASWLMMTIGVVTILLAVLMALVQKEYKRLLSYHAISQVGYMILGIGTAVPVGIVGGIFHMLNHAMYKCCLFLTAGAVEKQTGTTDLKNLGGLGRNMPVTFAAFMIAACSISGVPPFNGFFSKELIYDGALERGGFIYLAALLGSFFTAASFLKLGHSVFLGDRSEKNREVTEAPVFMLLPMAVLAVGCLTFGLFNAFPIEKFIEPILGPARLEGHHFSGFPHNMTLVAGTILVLAAALVNHFFGVRVSGSALGAADHIHYAPILKDVFDQAEQKKTDPYELCVRFTGWFSWLMFGVDRALDWFYEETVVLGTALVSSNLSLLHTGSFSLYLVWTMVAGACMVAYLMQAF